MNSSQTELWLEIEKNKIRDVYFPVVLKCVPERLFALTSNDKKLKKFAIFYQVHQPILNFALNFSDIGHQDPCIAV